MGRYKMGPQGGYYDANDSGPDQFTPQAGQQYPGMSPSGPQGPMGAPDANPGGISGQVPGQMRPWDVDMSGDPPPGYHWEWSGGVTGGKHPVPDGQHDPQIPGQGGPTTGQPIDTSGWPHKQYPGGVGGPIPPWLTGGEGGYKPFPNETPTQGPFPGVPGQGPYGREWTPTNQRPMPPWMPPQGPPPGMSQEAWQQGEDYLNSIKKPHTSIFGEQVPGNPQMTSGSGSLSSLVGKDLGSGKKASWMEQGLANGNLTANGSKWGGLGLGSLGSLAGFKK